MPPVNSLDEYSPWEDSMGTILRLDRIACSLHVILYRKCTNKYC